MRPAPKLTGRIAHQAGCKPVVRDARMVSLHGSHISSFGRPGHRLSHVCIGMSWPRHTVRCTSICPLEPMLSRVAQTNMGPPGGLTACTWARPCLRCAWLHMGLQAHGSLPVGKWLHARPSHAHMTWHASVCVARGAPCMPGQARARDLLCYANECDSMSNRCSAFVLSYQSPCSKSCSSTLQCFR